jgi:hypothetical protein
MKRAGGCWPHDCTLEPAAGGGNAARWCVCTRRIAGRRRRRTHQSRIETRPAWQRHVAALLLLMLVLAAVFPEIALQGKIFASPDYDQPSYFGVAGVPPTTPAPTRCGIPIFFSGCRASAA